MNVRYLSIAILCLMVTVFPAGSPRAETDMIQAKIGIQLQNAAGMFRAKSRERLTPGDLFRIYVLPQTYAFVYVVHTDGQTVSILSRSAREGYGAPLILPSMNSGYAVDGTSLSEQLTIIVSPDRLEALDRIESPGMTYKAWLAVRKDLTRKSRVNLSGKPQAPIPIGGTVRGLDADFIKHLATYSGRGVLVKHYEFTLQN